MHTDLTPGLLGYPLVSFPASLIPPKTPIQTPFRLTLLLLLLPGKEAAAVCACHAAASWHQQHQQQHQQCCQQQYQQQQLVMPAGDLLLLLHLLLCVRLSPCLAVLLWWQAYLSRLQLGSCW